MVRIRGDAAHDRLVKRPVHRTVTFFNRFATWSSGRLALSMLLLGIIVAAVWQVTVNELAVTVFSALILWIFFGADILLLLVARRKRISFGSWRAQFFPLALPRVLAAVTVALLALWLNTGLAFPIYAGIELLGSVLLLYGALIEPANVEITTLDIESSKLEGGPPLRILHISDLHIERFSRREKQIWNLVKAWQPDLILITGDYVNLTYNRDPDAYRRIRLFLSRLKARYGVYAVLGTPNVDLRPFVVPLFDGLPVTLLRDENRQIDLGMGREILLTGLDCTHDMVADGAIMTNLLQEPPATLFKLLLYHSPEIMPQAIGAGVDLYLCGHTHGGQVRLPIIGPLLTSSRLGRRYVMGLYHEGDTRLYNSRGVGFEGLSAPRVRLLCKPEVTKVTIYPAAADI